MKLRTEVLRKISLIFLYFCQCVSPAKHGKLALIKENNKFATIDHNAISINKTLLIPIFKNGKIINEVTFSEIKKNVDVF